MDRPPVPIRARTRRIRDLVRVAATCALIAFVVLTGTSRNAAAATATLLPNAVIDMDDDFSATGCSAGNAWQCVDEPITAPNDSDYAVLEGNLFQASNRWLGFAFGTTTVGTVTALEVGVRLSNPNASCNVKNFFLKNGGTTILASGARTITTAPANYAASVGSLALTQAALDNLTFELNMGSSCGSGAHTRIYSLSVEVTYVPPVAGTLLPDADRAGSGSMTTTGPAPCAPGARWECVNEAIPAAADDSDYVQGAVGSTTMRFELSTTSVLQVTAMTLRVRAGKSGGSCSMSAWSVRNSGGTVIVSGGSQALGGATNYAATASGLSVNQATLNGAYVEVTFSCSVGTDAHLYAVSVDITYAPSDTTAPTPAPMSGTAVADSPTQITWTADVASDETSLHTEPYSVDAGTPAWQASRTFVENGLSANAQYTRTVRARDAQSNESTGAITRWTLTNAPTSPSAAAQDWDATDGYAVLVSWGAPSGGAASYEIRSSSDGYATVVATSTTTTRLVTGLAANTAYTYKVCGVNTDGAAETTCSPATSATTPPDAPTSPASTSIMDTSASFAWAPVTGATAYELTISPNATCSAGSDITIDPASSPQPYASLSHDRAYTFLVRAYSTSSMAYGPPTDCTALSSATQRTALSVSVDSSTQHVGTGVPSSDLTATSTITTQTYGAPGYAISASVDQQLTNGVHVIPPTASGSIAAPGAWTGTGFGFTVSAATNLEPKWGAGTNYAALTTTPTQIHTTGAAFAPNSANTTATTVRYRVVVPPAQPVGAYGATVTYLVVPTA